MNSRVNNKDIMMFFGITFVVTWLLWLPSVLNSKGIEVPTFLLVISMMASFTPSITGLILLHKRTEKGQFKAKLKEKFSMQFNKIWFLVIGIIFPLMSGLALMLVKLIDDGYVVEQPIKPLFIPIVFLQILFIGGALGEELGWRGFVYERLEKLMTPFYSTLILGLLWSLWHLPLFLMDGTVQSNMPIWQFMLQNTIIAFYYTWVFKQTKGNMILMIYLHAVANTASAIFPYWQTAAGRYIGFAILIITLLGVSKIKIKSYETNKTDIG
jgi:hypothetical protein